MTEETQYNIIKDEYAEITAISHPLATAQGFTDITVGEMVVLENDVLGQILSYRDAELKLMIFSIHPVKVGTKLYRTKKQLSFPISEKMTGSIFNPLGEVLISPEEQQDNQESTFKEIFTTPLPITQRTRITDQLVTGFGITDLLLPIGSGQRELLIGDKKSGKTDFARRLTVKQAKSGNKVVYAMIAKKITDIKTNYEYFKKEGILDSVVIIATTPKDPISSIVITPHSAMTVAEELRNRGENVLLILDDLTSQAEYYREISLLAKKFPGRDSYPGDIFFSHAQLLERAGSFMNPKDSQKTVSITCLPVVRTTNNDLTDFIASNLISITDGHLLFDHKLFTQGIRPAVNIGLSVTRVGKQTQTPLQRDINLKITSYLTTYKKTKSLTHLGSEISDKSQEILKKGDLLTKFFSESDAIHINIQIILVSMIWLGWFNNAHEKVIDACKFELKKQYNTQENKKYIDKIITESTNFSDLISTMSKNKNELLKLCQI